MLSQAVVRLVELLLGNEASVRTELTFDAPTGIAAPDVPSLQEDIEAPSMRKGCVIGFERPSELPSSTRPLEIADLGVHRYGGPPMFQDMAIPASLDSIGHIYTLRGGIVDVAHARDHADLARYLTARVLGGFRSGTEIDLGDDTDPFRPDTGRRLISISPQNREPTLVEAARLGSYLSYLLAVWHEIATFKNWQDYSCFSPEDNYSNLLGTYLAFRACTTPAQQYDQMVTSELVQVLTNDMLALGKRATVDVVRLLQGRWYAYDEIAQMLNEPRPLASIIESASKGGPIEFAIYLYLIRRHCETGLTPSSVLGSGPGVVAPWLVTDSKGPIPDRILAALGPAPRPARLPIRVPTKNEQGQPLDDFFRFTVKDAASVDPSILDGVLVNRSLDSRKFGEVAERVRSRYLTEDARADRPD